MSPLRRLGPFWEVARDLARGAYPAFVTGGPLPRGSIPVFVFHSLEPVSFERRLRFLAENGYAALTADEHLEVLRGRRDPPERAVVLTVDDGRGSVWSVGAPLLARYGMRAVVFLVPGHVRSRGGPPLPRLGDPGADAAELARRDEGEHGLLYWEEIETLAAEARLDFQSHTLSHARVHTGPALRGFVTPRDRRGYAAFDVPLLHDGAGRDLAAAELPLGAPILESAPRLSAARRYYEPVADREACLRLVASEGGERFFARPGWERRLRGAFSRGAAGAGRFETDAEREAALRRELAESRRVIAAHTGRPVRHLCYPWHASCAEAERIAREEGYETAYAGKVEGAAITAVGGDHGAIARVGEDFLETLPGRGRASLAAVLRRKLLRRLSGRA